MWMSEIFLHWPIKIAEHSHTQEAGEKVEASRIQYYLTSLGMPSLTPEIRDELEEPITTEHGFGSL